MWKFTKSKGLFLLAASYLALSMLSFYTPAKTYATGGAIQISTCAQLQNIDNDLTANYVLTQDISCYGSGGWNGGAGFSPIGLAESGADFTGTLDGQGHTISGLTINRGTTSAAGLFYIIRGTSVRSINFSDTSITGHDNTGTLAAAVIDSNVSDVRAEDATVTSGAAENTGGLIGQLVGNSGDFSITGSWFSGTVTGFHDTGGLVGYVSFVNITNSYSTGSVAGTSNVGGLVGEFQDFWGISNTYSHSNVTASDDDAGGLVGQFGDGMHGAPFINNSYASGSVTSSADSVGGLVGLDIAATANSFAAGAVSAPSATHVGGFVGTYTAGDSNNNVYDRLRTGQASCAGGGSCSSIIANVTAVNTNASPNSSYFFNNFTNAPLSSWDASIWVKKASNFPVLQRPPYNVTAISTTPASTSINVSWTPPGTSDTPDITGYILKYRLGNLSNGWTSVNVAASSHPSFNITDLAPNTSYSIAIFTTDQYGNSGGIGVIAKTTNIISPSQGFSAGSSGSGTGFTYSNSAASSAAPDKATTVTSHARPAATASTQKQSAQSHKNSRLIAGVLAAIIGAGILYLIRRPTNKDF